MADDRVVLCLVETTCVGNFQAGTQSGTHRYSVCSLVGKSVTLSMTR